MKFTPRNIALAAVVGAAYCALTLLVAPIAFGVVQFRVSEALCILPAFFPMSAWGLWIGRPVHRGDSQEPSPAA